ncbi:MAG TPA: alpha/beta fold hydrolase [Xanthobacteraceae bacterium]|nr:alpha/beta fold hydrolase [Xanthobacteraceae bacterium]
MYEPQNYQTSPNLAFLWPAFFAAATSEMAGLAAKHFSNLAVGSDGPAAEEPAWATAHTVPLELNTVRLRDFSAEKNGNPTLICTPLALHGGAVADLATGHSLVSALRANGIRRLFAADWRAATQDMRLLGIDNYLADLNVLVDHIGSPIDLIGLCQGGWMALIYAARFPTKIRKLVLAGSPVDFAAAPSALSDVAKITPLATFGELVRIGDGIVPGRKVLKFWGVELVLIEDIRQVLQTSCAVGSPEFAALEALFRNWYGWTIDLPGRYFLDVVDKLYKKNQLASGKFVALGRRVDLAELRTPMFLLAAAEDELVSPPQLLAAERLVGSKKGDIRKQIVPGRHVGLFMGKNTLDNVWPEIAGWLSEPIAVEKAALAAAH